MFLRCVITLIVIVYILPVSAQIATESIEPSAIYPLKSITSKVDMPVVDVEKLKIEDELEQIKGELPPRFGEKSMVQLSPKTHGEFTVLPNGDRVWRMRVYSKDAFSINFLFDKFRLSPKSELFLYNEDKSYIIGAFTASNNKADGMFATAPVKGDLVTLELYEPKEEIGQSIVSVSHVVHAYRNLFRLADEGSRGFGDSGACNIDVECPESVGWEDQINSVALIIVNGSRSCSGAMVNNTAEDGVPYFLSANHCGTDMDNSWVYVFDYKSPTCGGVDGDLTNSITGSTLVANYSPSDMTLAELTSAPPPAYTVFYAGWDITNNASPGATGIHHPRGDVMKISHNTDALYSGNWGTGASNVPSGNHWVVDDWEEGTTEPGSSGSALFNTENRIVGQLHGGGASCSNITYDSYGKTFTSWTGGGSAASRLSDHLDPLNSAVNFMDGTYIVPPVLDIAVSRINGLEQDGCETNFELVVEVRNNGSTPINTFELEYTVDGVSQDSSVTGLNLAIGEVVNILIVDQDFTVGVHSIEAVVSLPNGSTDGNALNNSLNETWTVTTGEILTVEFLADDYPGESSFDVQDSNGNVVVFESDIVDGLNSFTYCLEAGCYTFTIYDSFGDGICCGYGNGSYSIFDGDNVLIGTGGEFDSEESTPFCFEAGECSETVYFVDANATGTGDGGSWANAFTGLHQIDPAIVGNECTEVWVAEGTYYPGIQDRSSSIVFRNDFQYYGGFEAGMTNREDRDMLMYPVILSGDINVLGSSDDNAYHVVAFDASINPTCIVDGFTIIAGNANGPSASDKNGAGIFNLGGSPTIRNLTITGNSSLGDGSGIYIDGGNPVLENIECIQNSGENIFVASGDVQFKGTNTID